MRIKGSVVEVTVGKECYATEEDYYASEYGDRQEYDPVSEKTFLNIKTVTEDGKVFRHCHSFHLNDENKVEAFAQKVNATDQEWNKDCWSFDRYIYGSVAFQQNEKEANYMMMDDEEKAFYY
jgi:nitrate/TMAO reductase-like tetraheme cytochrome c subunit|tara:strand:+ start:577 stop:942 length:366 start_codon:yes stop_codon:yes gene_type:complete